MKEETRKLLIKAERAIRAAEALRLRGDADFAVGRANSWPPLDSSWALSKKRVDRTRNNADPRRSPRRMSAPG